MNKETIEIPLVKATYEELQQVICELQVERYKYKIVLDKIKKYIKEKDLTNNMNFMDDGIGNLFKDILELLEEIE